MKLIIIEDGAYKVSEKEYLKIKSLEDNLKDPFIAFNHKESWKHEDILANYLDENKHKYTFIDSIWFHYQR